MLDKIGEASTRCSTRHMTGIPGVLESSYICIVNQSQALFEILVQRTHSEGRGGNFK